MTRFLAATAFLALAAAPAFACEWQNSASTDTRTRTVASQPAADHSAPRPSTTTDRNPS
jgi:hypothetical protein